MGKLVFLIGFWSAVFSSLLGVWQGVPYLFADFLALTLLIMNNRTAWVGRRFRSGWLTNPALLITLLFFVCIGGNQIVSKLKKLMVDS